jgi:hypothetical protein
MHPNTELMRKATELLGTGDVPGFLALHTTWLCTSREGVPWPERTGVVTASRLRCKRRWNYWTGHRPFSLMMTSRATSMRSRS